MTKKFIGDLTKDLLSRSWSIITGVVVILLIVDSIITSLPSYDLQSHQSLSVHLLFGAELSFCALCQMFYLNIIKRKYTDKPTIGYFRRYADITYFVALIAQCAIICLLFVTLVEIEISSKYHMAIILICVLLSLCLSIGISSLLAFRFIMWLRIKVDYLIVAYTAAAALITINSIFVAIFISLEVQGKPTIIDTSFFWTNTQIINYDIHQIQSNILLASFFSLWIASIFLLRRQRSAWRTFKFYIVVLIPLLYYLGFLQLPISDVLIQHRLVNTVGIYTFNVVNAILSRPVGGALFGIAFWIIARSIPDKNISDYMKIAAIGMMLLSMSNVDAGLYLLPYPPFGVVTLTFVGISSYMLFVGIYYSSISVSMNAELRKSIEKSVKEEIRFISEIGRSQVQREIQGRVKRVTKRSAKMLEENSGVEAPLQEEDIEEYINLVLREKERFTDTNTNKEGAST